MKRFPLLAAFLLALLTPGVEAQTIPNPSFEIGNLDGWTARPANAGSGVGAGPVADNGAIPQGSKVAALSINQQSPGNTSSASALSTTISGLTVGAEYWLTVRLNSSTSGAVPGCGLKVAENIVGYLDTVPIVGASNPYNMLGCSFKAASVSETLTIEFTFFQTLTLLVDDFKIVKKEPIVVANTADSGAGSLRQALADAAAAGGPDTITFAPGLAGQTISLGSMISINDAGGVTVDASSLPRGLTIDDGASTTFSLFELMPGSKVTFRALTFANGGGPGASLDGGAIHTRATPLTLENCLFTGNQAFRGGAILTTEGGVTTLTNCTLVDNHASSQGGAIACFSGAAVTLTHCTVTENAATSQGGGIYIFQSAATLRNSIVSKNISSGAKDIFLSGSNANHKLTYVGANLVIWLEDNGGSVIGSASIADSLLSPLADNGGPTKTTAPLPGSPALDAAVDSTNATDQRGFTRNRDGNQDGISMADIGAYEAQAAPVASIGLNLRDASGTDAVGGGSVGAPNFQQYGWLNLMNSVNPGGLSGDTGSVPGLKLWWKAPWTYSLPVAGDTQDKKLMRGYLDSNGSGDGSAATDLFNTVAAQPYVAVAGLPSAFTQGGYKVLVYADTDAADGRTFRHWLTSNRGQNPGNVATETALTAPIHTRDASNFSGTYTRSTSTVDIGSSTKAGNYVIFPSLTEPGGFIVRAEEGSLPAGEGRVPINAVQIVHNEIVMVTTVADENDPFGTLGAGLSLREALRDAPDGAGILFDPALSGQTITLGGSEIVLTKSVTIDASSLAGGLTIYANHTSRIFSVDIDCSVTLVGLNLTGGVCTDSDGGAINNQGSLSVVRCSLYGNLASGSTTGFAGNGGAISSIGWLTIAESTLSGNYSSRSGGALNLNGTASLTGVTIYGNTANFGIASGGAGGGGIATTGGQFHLTNCIIAGNTGTADGGLDIRKNLGGSIIPHGANFIGSNETVTSEFPTGDLVGTSANRKDPMLATLGAHGGPTLSQPPLPGSPVLDRAVGSAATTDQRGYPRPRNGDAIGGAEADLGAVERLSASDFFVTSTADSGPGSLRQVLAHANQEGGSVTITFPAHFVGPIVLSSEIVVPAGNQVTIDASNVTGGLVIDGGGTNRLFSLTGGHLTLFSLTLTGGSSDNGGAILNSAGSILNLANSTLSGNRASLDGGAIHSSGAGAILVLSQCTLAGNSAATNGGAIYSANGTELTCSTLSGNSGAAGGGIFFTAGDLLLVNNIVAGNSAPTGPDIRLTGGNPYITAPLLISSLADSGLTTASGNVIVNPDPKLSPLGNYGGRTPTMLPLAGSPAIDPAIGAANSSNITKDQRGSARVFGDRLDIGAVERGRIVTSIANAGAGSLRTLVENLGIGADLSVVINFDPALDGQTINLASTINLNKNVEINAGGLPSGITVNGGSLNNRLFVIFENKTVALHNLKLINGGGTNFDDFGGAISNEGDLKLTRCTLSGNKVKLGSTPGNSGGAIETYASTSLFMEDCFLTQNEADFGGAITADVASWVTLSRCSLSGNHARDGHGGALNGIAAYLTLSQCTVAGNTAKGLTLGATGGRNGFGGGIMNYDSGGTPTTLGAYGSLTLTQCTVANNIAYGYGGYAYGGGVFYRGESHLANCILAGNQAQGNPGNDATGIPRVSGQDMFETEIAGYPAAYSFAGRILIQNLEGTFFFKDAQNNVLDGDPQLAPLGDYGGPTPTMPPLAGSQVIDKAAPTLRAVSEVSSKVTSSLNSRFTTDQRGYPLPVGAAADLGAAESGTVRLKSLVLSAGALSPVFQGTTTSYTASVPYATASLTVTPTAVGIGTSITVNGNTVVSGAASGSIALNEGANTITVAVTGPQGAQKTYTFTVTRAGVGSINADLSGLTFAEGTLSPEFASGTTSYTASVPSGTSTVHLKPTLANGNATLQVTCDDLGAVQLEGGIFFMELNFGENPITVKVTAPDGTTTKTYTIIITRQGSSNADLSGLTLSAGILNPTFAGGTTSYTTDVPAGTSSVTVTPTAADANATIKVNNTVVASGAASGGITVPSTITVSVTAQDGTTIKTYTVAVTTPNKIPSVALSSNFPSSVTGLSVTFTAVVTGAGTPTGTVTFFDGAAPLGTVALGGGTARLSTSALTLGSHSITATYNGDTAFLSATSSILTQTMADASLGVTSTANGGPGSLRQALLSAGTISGPDVIILPAGATITLTQELVLTDPDGVTIDGSAGGVKIQGLETHRLINVVGGKATLRGLWFSGGAQGSSPDGGGGVRNAGQLTAENCTFTENTAGQGGALMNEGGATLALSNCTLTQNFAGSGSAIVTKGSLSMTHCTVTGNMAFNYSALELQDGGQLTATNCIVMGNFSQGSAPDVQDLLQSQITLKGNNLFRFTNAYGPAPVLSPLLAPLGDYGGPVPTMPPLPGSPAVDQATVLTPPLTTDQRGLPRPFGVAPDLGAVEASILIVNTTADKLDAPGHIKGGLSLREALRDVPVGGVITFDRGLFTGATATTNTITLTQGPLNPAKNCTLDGSTNPGGIKIVHAPVFTQQPQPQYVSATTPATFTAAVPSLSGGLAYQWRRNAQNLDGQTAATLSIASTQESDEGIYDVVLSEVAAPGTLTLTGVTLAPLTTASQGASLIVNGAGSLTVPIGPKSALIPLGGAYTMSVTAIGPVSPALTYQWRKGTTNIGGATKSSYAILKATLTNAGAYTCVVKSGTTLVTSSTAEIGVVDPAIKPVTVALGGNFTTTIAAAGTGLSYLWTGGSTGQGLSISAVQAANEGLYTCTVTGPGGDQISGGTRLFVFTAKPDLGTLDLPPAAIGQAYFYQIPVTVVAGASALTYSVIGLPTGITCNTATGVISGRPTVTKSGGYALTIKATNSKGYDSGTATLNVISVPATAVGVFAGPAERSPLNDNLGGRFDLTTTPTGTFSGSVTLGARAKLSFTAQLLQSSGLGDMTLQGRITGLTMSDKIPLTATVEVSAVDQTAWLTLVHPNGTTLVIPAWRNPWSTKAPATAYAAYYTARLDAGMQDDAPQGYGFTSFTIAPTGLLTLAGKLADGTGITGGGAVSKDGQIPVFSLLYTSRGSHVGHFTITRATPVANNTIDGDTSWFKPTPLATSTDTVYKAGFGPLPVAVEGGTYPAPAKGQRVMGLPVAMSPTGYNAKLDVAFNDMGSAADFDQRLRITNPSATGLTNTVAIVTPVSNTTTMTTLTAPTGLFSGAFTMTTPVGSKPRPAPYFGQIVKINGVTRGYGYYLLPTVPVLPKTVTTSPKLSGRVELRVP